MKDFTVVSGANQETGMSSVNGVVDQYTAVSYILQARHTGTITLGKATANIGGKEYSSSPVKITVNNTTSGRKPSQGNASANPFAGLSPFDMAPPPTREDFRDFILRKGESVPEKVSKNMMLKLETNKTSCYVGEPVVASYRLYTRLKSQSRLTENPSFNGFSVIDLQQPDETDYARQKVNGREFNVYTIRKAQLYPLQDGEIELEKATLENKIDFLRDDSDGGPSDVNSFLNGFRLSPDALITETVSLTSKPVRITVKPLPEAGKPASFKGAVGKFTMHTILEKDHFSTDETGKLIIIIEGRGNMQLLTSPDINWPKELEAFDQKVSEDLVQTDVPVSGRKIFEIPFSIMEKGNYKVPSVSFSYFDPAIASYKTINTNPISFTVEKGVRNSSFIPGNIKKAKPGSFAKKMFDNRGWIVGVIAILFGFGLFFWLRQDKKASIKEQEEFVPKPQQEVVEDLYANTLATNAAGEPQNPLSETEDCLQGEECYEFYTILNNELKQFLSQKVAVPAHQISARNIAEVLDNAGIDNGIALKTENLLQELEWQLYTPFERNDTMQLLYSKAQEVVQQLNIMQKTSA